MNPNPNPNQPNWISVEDTKDEEEPLPTPTSKPSRGGRMKSMSKKNKEKEPQVEKQKRVRNAWTQDEESLLTECFIQVSEDPKIGCDQKRDTFWYKIQNVYNKEAKKKGFTERTKNMLTGKWTPMNTAVLKFNQLVQETAVHSKHKWTNPDSTLQRRSRLLGTDEEPEHFGDDELPRPPGLQRLAKSQRTGSNSTASSGSNPAAYQEFMAEQYELDRKAKMTVLERESEDRRRLIQSQRIAEDMRVLQIDTRGMDPVDAAIINAQKAKIRAAYPPPPN
ncbi:hypothetical protein Tco_0936791 [Tanacetum coccineum]|uniref:No apical meristem-associated C-terminal domain-containing protein n=1 Tax=Tanacetum coccineum TaxID=301880 RepID=A0ABQ5DCE0_9ASTR